MVWLWQAACTMLWLCVVSTVYTMQHTAATSLLEAEKAKLMATRDKLATANEKPTAKLTAKQ